MSISPLNLENRMHATLPLTNFEARPRRRKQRDGERCVASPFSNRSSPSPIYKSGEENGDGQPSPRKAQIAEVKKRETFSKTNVRRETKITAAANRW
jgi:hypothetical protein